MQGRSPSTAGHRRSEGVPEEEAGWQEERAHSAAEEGWENTAEILSSTEIFESSNSCHGQAQECLLTLRPAWPQRCLRRSRRGAWMSSCRCHKATPARLSRRARKSPPLLESHPFTSKPSALYLELCFPPRPHLPLNPAEDSSTAHPQVQFRGPVPQSLSRTA